MNLIIVGGSDAGISAALRAKELDPSIVPTVIVADHFPNYSICGLPYYISHDVGDSRELAHRTKEDIENEGVKLLLGHTVLSVNPDSRQVAVVDESGTKGTHDYDKLVIGTGALSVRPPIGGLDNEGVFLLRFLPDAFAIEQFIESRRPQRAVIVGAGYIGLEMCEALTKLGMSVTVAEFAPSVMPSIDADFSGPIRNELTRNGVAVHLSVGIQAIEKRGRELIVRGAEGFELSANMVLVAAGATPNTALGRETGMETGAKGAFKVNRRMETNIPDIYAAGDCAETWHRILQKNTYMPLGTVAHKQGRIAGENALGGNAEFAGTLGTQSVKVFDTVVARTGLNDNEARDAGFEPVQAELETWDHKVYYPSAQRLHIRVTADRKTRRLLGAQIIGAYGTEVSKRIDIFATSLHHKATTDQFLEYDLSYAPPLSSPWDPVQMAVQNLERKIAC